ncbi:archease [bacterium]|nr:archease [bacterium]
MRKQRYKYIDHTGDVGLEAWGETYEALFINAAYGMLDLLFDRGKTAKNEHKNLEVQAEDIEILLVDWLSEIKYLSYKFLTNEIIIDKMNENTIKAKLYGEKYNPESHEVLREIKNVTYHQLRVEKLKDGFYHAKVIFDV